MTEQATVSPHTGARRFVHRLIGLNAVLVLVALFLRAESPIPIMAWATPLIVVWLFAPVRPSSVLPTLKPGLDQAIDTGADCLLLVAAASWLSLVATSVAGLAMPQALTLGAALLVPWLGLRLALVPWLERKAALA
ncbi:MAG: hypothetical protein KDA24_27180 [Deltaproteobacteria bacterium]|nr:hypothetical protein [Deltaproteobacteria bacterium]